MFKRRIKIFDTNNPNIILELSSEFEDSLLSKPITKDGVPIGFLASDLNLEKIGSKWFADVYVFQDINIEYINYMVVGETKSNGVFYAKYLSEVMVKGED